MNCRELDWELDNYLTGRCEEQTRLAVSAHLQTCRNCRELCRALQRLLEAIPTRPPPEKGLRPDFTDCVMVQVHARVLRHDHHDSSVERVPPVETKPVETKPVETKPVETKPVETKPVETKPVETKPVETKPVETKPVETKPVETKPVISPSVPPLWTSLWTQWRTRRPALRPALWGWLAAAAALSLAVLLPRASPDFWGGSEPPKLPAVHDGTVASNTPPSQADLSRPVPSYGTALNPTSAHTQRKSPFSVAQATDPQRVGRAADRIGQQLLSTLEVVTPSVPPVSHVAGELPHEFAGYGFPAYGFPGYSLKSAGFVDTVMSSPVSENTSTDLPTPPLELVGQRGSEIVRAGVGITRKPAESLLSFVVRQGRSFRPADKSDKPRGS